MRRLYIVIKKCITERLIIGILCHILTCKLGLYFTLEDVDFGLFPQSFRKHIFCILEKENFKVKVYYKKCLLYTNEVLEKVLLIKKTCAIKNMYIAKC